MADCDSVMPEPPTATPPLATGEAEGCAENKAGVGDQVGDRSTTTNREGSGGARNDRRNERMQVVDKQQRQVDGIQKVYGC